jgi:NAD(P)H-dependent FMN reductase
MSNKLHVVIASTRPGRAGRAVGDWFIEQARSDGRFDVGVTDLVELALPFFDEPHHPRMRTYVHEHTRTWSAAVDFADAFVFVMPEYNHGYPASIKNAVDYLYEEWADKPVGFVSYGGMAGGTRAVQSLKPVLTYLRMRPVVNEVTCVGFSQFLNDGVFEPGEPAAVASKLLLDELDEAASSLAEQRGLKQDRA